MPATEQDPACEIEFQKLPLDDTLLRALDDIGFVHCTPIQAAGLPIILDGFDIAAQAQTGTGKTAAFLLATMQRLLSIKRPPANIQDPRAVIITPTRELAIQIYNDAVALNTYSNLSLVLVYGGTDYEKQRQQLSHEVDILIGTPGRLIDYHKQHIYQLKYTEIAILDEADRMFDLGFIRDIRYLLRRMPKPAQRLNMLFSATLSHRVLELAYEHMNNPRRVSVHAERITADNIKETLYHVAKEDKVTLLIYLLPIIAAEKTIIFINTKQVAERINNYLQINALSAGVLSGDVPQRKRQRLLERFSAGSIPILIATDVAARGLHIPGVSHIINYDLPQNAEDYVHRIGRTARAGASGDAISFACEEYVYSLPDIEQYIEHSIPVSAPPDLTTMTIRHPDPRQQAPKKKRRQSRHNSRQSRT